MDAQPNMFPETELTPDEFPDERYTLRGTLDLCKRIAGVSEFDIDVAACLESHCAAAWIDHRANGLLCGWRGRVWCNPPFSDIEAWVKKAWAEHDSGRTTVIAMLLPANRTEQPWWQQHIESRRDDYSLAHGLFTYFLAGRVKFGFPGNPLGTGVGSPPFGCVLLVWRKQ
jgi:DNA N-6-adenine-methyltransferase (Dam)